MENMEVDPLPSLADEEEEEEEDDGLNGYFMEFLPGLIHAIKICVKEADVKSIDVGNLNLEAEHLKPIIDLLPNTQVTEFSAENSNLQWGVPDFANQLTKSNIEKLNFKNCSLRVQDVLALMEALKNTKVTDLDLSCLSIPESYSLNSAKKIFILIVKSHLTHLRLSGSSLLGHSSGRDLALHLPHTSVTYLWLEQTDLRHDKEALKDLFTTLPKTFITELYLGCNEIKNEQLKPLCENLKQTKLKVLDLHSNEITDAGMNLLSEALVGSKVHQLNVATNKISGANNLGKHLKDTSITILHLGWNKLKNHKMFSFPNFLKDTLVTELRFDSCDLGDEVAQNLMKCLKSSEVTKVILSKNNLGLPTVLEFVSIIKETKITEVDFSENHFSAEALQVLGESIKGSKLKHFTLRGELKKLQEGSPIAAFIDKTKGTALESLDISCTNFENESAILASSLKNTTLTHLNLSSCQIEVGIADLAPALKHTTITDLNLSSNKLGDVGAEKLAKFLKETKIFKLDVMNNVISFRGAKALVLCLKSGPLYQLNLELNKITNGGIEELVEVVERTYITDLEVSCNSGCKTLPLVVELWRNRCLVGKFVNLFNKIAPIDGCTFRFYSNFERHIYNFSVEKFLHFHKAVVEEPSCISALANDKSVPFSRDQLVKILEEFPTQFASFIKNESSLKLSQRVNVLERANVLKARKIAESILSDLAALLLDDGVLMPITFKLLVKHKELICSVVSKPEDKKIIMEKLSKPPACGLCGKTKKLTKTKCCNRWICDDEHKYIPFSYGLNSCCRNHRRHSLCAFHYTEGHEGKWQNCDECKDVGVNDFPMPDL